MFTSCYIILICYPGTSKRSGVIVGTTIGTGLTVIVAVLAGALVMYRKRQGCFRNKEEDQQGFDNPNYDNKPETLQIGPTSEDASA